ncbi:hypothetical protein P691DRAFT_808763 [Macrolepiota fuliginosa MF-IS2]|uniref:DUF6534 domain-containing protein n=1 Tax=Macrolepiota fuliginosa MF-IS2 TaxID=1400762 RepID=A0A9P6C4B9_9AGAR|nr:hypothetical protein P691DRAFT_808763 [Macrolepiota fuliginosa MF-IS2]
MVFLQKLAGPLLIGYLLNLCLLGVLFVQVFIYSVAFNKPNARDNIGLKLIVYVVVCLEVIQSAFILRDAFVTFAEEYGTPTRLNNIQFTWLTMPVLSGLVSCIVQSFYAFRIHVLAGSSYVLPTFIVLLAVTQCVASIAVGIDEHNTHESNVFTQVGVVGNYIWPIVSTICDIIIVFAMTYYIMKTNRRLNDSHTGRRSPQPTNIILCRALHLTVETGALTATISLLYFVLWFFYPLYYYHMTFAFIMGKVYANSLMVAFNSRVLISDLRDNPRFLGNIESV